MGKDPGQGNKSHTEDRYAPRHHRRGGELQLHHGSSRAAKVCRHEPHLYLPLLRTVTVHAPRRGVDITFPRGPVVRALSAGRGFHPAGSEEPPGYVVGGQAQGVQDGGYLRILQEVPR
ncbi:MAG: hypothetical protein MZV64_09695 [Ignavibacteriales bacterium]|nr:hypothetical protein [Ignavibacteriales bacterium]